jgi:Tfp pilus assembly protein PilX
MRTRFVVGRYHSGTGRFRDRGKGILGRNDTGMALVITLSLIVLVTIAAMAFFSRATSNRLIETTRSNQVLVRQTTETAADYIAAQFLQEIAENSSSNSTTGTTTIYGQTNNVFALPQRPLPTALASDTNFANLVRRSVNEATNGVGETNASDHNSSTPAKNGRLVDSNRWNAPMLLGGAGFTSSNELPNWIYLNGNGTVTATPSTNAVGRFAYNVYDTGGLLDINAFGHGATMPGVFRKGSPSTADLRVIPGIAASAVRNDGTLSWPPTWRLTGPWANFRPETGSFPHYHETGWLKPWPGDRIFTSRQDLIRYAKTNPGTFETLGNTIPALQYFTTFSRDIDAPSFAPNPNRSRIRTLANGGNDAFGLDDEINPDLANVRVTTAFTRPDGSAARPGEPLLASRFPLSRLQLLAAPPSATNASVVQRFFGLAWDATNNRWNYNHGNPANILRLADVAAAGREPDMIELLKAAITAGSLGKRSGITMFLATSAHGSTDGTDPYRNARDISLNYQIIQIAANIIDQADPDNLPTRVRFDGRDFYGIENLPYLTAIRRGHVINDPPVTDPPTPGAHPLVSIFYQYQLWNPHDQTSIGTGAPTEFRIVTEVEGLTSVRNADPAWAGPQVAFNASSTLEFILPTGNFTQPGYVQAGTTITGRNGAYRGTFLQTSPWRSPNEQLGVPGVTPPPAVVGVLIIPTVPGADIQLQYRRGGSWITYDRLENFVCTVSWRVGRPNGAPNDQHLFINRYRVDPRTSRFGLGGGSIDGPGTATPIMANDTNTVWPSMTGGFSPPNPGGWGFLRGYPDIGLGRYSQPDLTDVGWSPGTRSIGAWWDTGWWMATISRNATPGTDVTYTDPDGVLRRADGAFASGTVGLPLINNNTPSRPIILNRPFRSVGELGYVFRGTPWKNLDFFTPESGDAALLDVFCIDEPAPGGITAGRVNLNTRQWPVLKALLAGGGKLDDGTANLTDAEAEALAQALVDRTTSTTPNEGPLLYRSDLVGRNTGGTNFTGFSADVGTHLSGPDAAIKRRREAAVRALADVGTTRTWNLLADIVVQIGRFPTGGSTNAGDFIVEGEIQTWEHIAIDRATAKIIARKNETVTE